MKSNLKILIVDNIGSAYLSVALHLRDYFQTVGYYSVNQSPFPYIQNDASGTGYPDIIRVDELLDHLDEWDIYFFPDIYFVDYGILLRSLGKMVWGACPSELLETDREVFYREKEMVGMPSIPIDIINGIDNLIEYTKTNGNKWVKVSYYRGILETYHLTNFKSSEIFLDNLKAELGPLGNEINFIIEDNMKAICEVGGDMYTVNGIIPSIIQYGIEVKDSGYVCKWEITDNLPDPVKYVNSSFSSVLQKFGHTGNFSTEIRYTEDGQSFFTDPCVRVGSPSGNCLFKNVSNWDQIIPLACEGKLVDPIFKNKYSCEIILKDTYVNTRFLAVDFPPEFENNIFLKNSFIRDGVHYVSPFNKVGFELEQFGSVVTIGDNLQDTINDCLNIASSIDTFNLTYDKSALDAAMKEIHNLEQILNIKF